MIYCFDGIWAASKNNMLVLVDPFPEEEMQIRHQRWITNCLADCQKDLPPNIGEQCAVVLVDPFWGGLGMAIWFSGPAAEGKCVPWEFPLFSGCPRMPSVRRAELEGSWWLDSKLDIFPSPSLHPPYFVSKYSLPHVSLFCLPASLLHSRSPLSLLCCETALQCTRSPGFGETQISS